MTFKTPLLVLPALLLLHACGGGGSTSSSAGINLDFSAQLRPRLEVDSSLNPLAAGPKHFTNSEGIEITLNKAYLVISNITLESDCGDERFAWQWPDSWLALLIPSAYAHSTSSPTQTGEPHVIDILSADQQAVDLGSLAPASGDYCGISIDLSRADADAVGMPDDTSMVDLTLLLEGSYRVEGGDAIGFSQSTGMSLLPARRLFASTLHLGSEQRSTQVLVNIDYQTWFDQIDLSQISTEQEQSRLLDNIVTSLSVDSGQP